MEDRLTLCSFVGGINEPTHVGSWRPSNGRWITSVRTRIDRRHMWIWNEISSQFRRQLVKVLAPRPMSECKRHRLPNVSTAIYGVAPNDDR